MSKFFGIVQRISFFRDAALTATAPLAVAEIQGLVEKSVSLFDFSFGAMLMGYRYLTRDAPVLRELQSARRPGRPSSTKEDLLGQRMETEEKEYGSGYWVPDMRDEGTLERLVEWKGEWAGLGRLKWVRVRRDGEVRGSEWPPTGGA